jgi:hypothetical protein
MGKFWLRQLSFVLGNGSQSIDVSQLRCRFTVTQNVIDSPDQLDARITNLSPTTESLITKEFDQVQMTCGYEGMTGLIFKGQIKWFRKGRESPTDTYMDITAQTADKAYNFGVVNKTLPAGSTPKDHVNTALKALQAIDPTITMGLVTPDLSTPVYPRSFPLYGAARNMLRNVGLLKGATFNIYNNMLQMLEIQRTLQTQAITLNSMTGLIGRAVQTPNGIDARCLFNPAIKPHCVVIINQSSIDAAAAAALLQGGPSGLSSQELATLQSNTVPNIAADGRYKVLHMNITGDTRGTPWYMDLTCLAIGDTSGGAATAAARGYPRKANDVSGYVPNSSGTCAR